MLKRILCVVFGAVLLLATAPPVSHIPTMGAGMIRVPTPAPTSSIPAAPSKVYPVWAYYGAAVGGCSNTDPGTTAARALYTVLDYCGGTGFSRSTLDGECARGTGCRPGFYDAYFQTECTTTDAQESGGFNYRNTSDETGFLHDATPYGPGNRFYWQKGTGTTWCDPHTFTVNGVSTTYSYYAYANPGDAAYNTWYYNNVYVPTTYELNNNWIGMSDDMSTGPNPGGVHDWNNAVVFAEYTTIPTWRAATAIHFNSLCPTKGTSGCYNVAVNSLGPGGSKYEPAGATGTAIDNIDWSTDVDDVCNNLTQGNFYAFISEDPFDNGAATLPTNSKVILNTSTRIWGNANCNNIKLITLDRVTTNQTLGDQIRRLQTAFSWLATPMDGSPRVMRWNYVANTTSAVNQAAWYPEYAVVVAGPEKTIHPWHWGGTSDGNGAGCNGGNQGDSGGTVDLAVQGICPTSANYGRYDNGVYVQQFKYCYIGDTYLGSCAAGINGTDQAQTISSSWFPVDSMGIYKHYLTWTGFEATSATIDGTTYPTNCTDSTYCNGVLDTTSHPFPGIPPGGTTSNVVPAGEAFLLISW